MLDTKAMKERCERATVGKWEVDGNGYIWGAYGSVVCHVRDNRHSNRE